MLTHPKLAARALAGTLLVGLASGCGTAAPVGASYPLTTPRSSSPGVLTQTPTARRSPTAAATCPDRAGVVFPLAVHGSPPGATIVLRAARYVCGGADDGHFSPVGHRFGYPLAPGVRIRLLTQGPNGFVLENATLAELEELLRSKSTAATRFPWFGAGFLERRDRGGSIRALTELYRP